MRVAGVDGCKGGWVAVIIEPDGSGQAMRIAQLADLFGRPLAPDIVAVDMPIGLPDRIGAKGRAPERRVRPNLGQRQSSVFSMPSRAAVEAAEDDSVPEEERYRHVCTLARHTSYPPRAVAKQGYALFSRILDIDRWLRANPDLQPRVFECHPEVSFWAMNGEHPLALPKKVQNRPNPEGLEERRSLLGRAGFTEDLCSAIKARALGVGQDDLIDACAAAWTARRLASGEAVSFPPVPEHDSYGLRIAIHA